MKRAVFLDRDGVICVEKNLLHKKEELELILLAGEAIKLLNDAGYLVIVVTNQPVVARGLCTIAELEGINNYLKSLLQQKGAKLDQIYYCPHHPNPQKGRIGENGPNQEYVKECVCRKPKPGMILMAQKDFGIEDLSQCYMIGDKTSDIKSGYNAGCRTILVESDRLDPFYDAVPDFHAKDLYHAVKDIVLKKLE